MVVIENQLVLVGGDEHGDEAKVLGVWKADHKAWTHPYPEMPTARSHCSAVAYNDWLIVAGGARRRLLSAVEVLNICAKQWYSGPSTPIPWRSMKTAVVGSIGYFMGGWDSTSHTEKVYRLSIHTLISHINSKTSRCKIWNEISGSVVLVNQN